MTWQNILPHWHGWNQNGFHSNSMSGNEWKVLFGQIHQILHDEIEMFAMHPLPPTTQETCYHLYEINISAIKEISNRHLILLCARRWTRVNDVNLSIPWWRNFSRWQNNSLQSLSSLPPICLLRWKLECCCSPNKIVIVNFWPSLKIFKLVTRSYTFICK
jgi:hypothetical protein